MVDRSEDPQAKELDDTRSINQPVRPEAARESTVEATGPSTTPEADTSQAGFPFQLPGYQIEGEIARGGMGCVLDAREIRLDRPVAIKLLLPGASSERFVNEALITARLPHPGIPPVYALGTLDDGSHYLAMKRVWGKTLAAELSEVADPAAERSRWIAIFEQLAQAVGFAHSKQVVHRDLKPANIMVGAFGEVQVMDWGLAKFQETEDRQRAADSQPHLDHRDLTLQGTVMGTPGYMSPEQARGEPVDARSDVFALGAILFQMLTGERMVSGSDALDTIRKMAAWTSGDVRQRLRARHVDEQLADITCQCVAERAEDRPAHASQVATLIGDYRRSLEARLKQAEQSRAISETRAIEQGKRRRAMTVATTALLVILALGLIGTSIGFYQANLARAAEQERANGELAAKRETQRRLEQLARHNEILTNIFADLDARYAVNDEEPLPAVLARRLVAACQLLQGDSIADPLQAAGIQRQLGKTLLSLSKPVEAAQMLKMSWETQARVLGNKHRDTLTTQANLAIASVHAGHGERALTLLEATVSALREVLGPDHMDTLSCQTNLAEVYRTHRRLDEAIPLLEACVEQYARLYGETHQNTLSARNNLSLAYLNSGRYAEAEKIQRENVSRSRKALGENHLDTLMAMSRLGSTKMHLGHFQEALALLQPAHQGMSQRFGWNHHETLNCVVNISMCYLRLNRVKEAVPLLQEAEQRAVAVYTAEHRETVGIMNNLGHAYLSAGRAAEALAQFEKTFEARTRMLGPYHRDTLMSMENIMVTQVRLGRLDEALELAESAIPLMKTHLGESDIYTLNGIHKLAMICERAGKLERATQLCEEILPTLRETVGVENPHTYSVAYMLASLYGRAERHDEAIDTLADLHQALVAKVGATHGTTVEALKQVARAHARAGQMDAAETWWERLVDVQREPLRPSPLKLAEVLEAVATECLEWQAYSLAGELLGESLRVRRETAGDSWMASYVQARLGGVMLRQAQARSDDDPLKQPGLREANEYLLNGYRGMQAEVESVPAEAGRQLAECAEMLVEYYDTVGEAESSQAWRERLRRIRNQPSEPTSSKRS